MGFCRQHIFPLFTPSPYAASLQLQVLHCGDTDSCFLTSSTQVVSSHKEMFCDQTLLSRKVYIKFYIPGSKHGRLNSGGMGIESVENMLNTSV